MFQRKNIASMYMSGDVKLWWRTWLQKDEMWIGQKFLTWDGLQKEMKD